MTGAVTVAITAVICTRNRVAFVEKCLQSLFTQSLGRDRYEILVVNNGSTDATGDILRRYAGEPGIRVVNEPVIGLSRARNTGWREAAGEFVGYIDDDAVAAPTWLESALWSFRHVRPQPDWVGGPIDLEWETANPGWIDAELAVPLGLVDWGGTPRTLCFPERLGGGNSFFPRERLREIGGFDERLGRGGYGLLSGEETQLQQRLEAAGGSLYYHSGVRIHHFVPKERTRPVWFYRRYYWGGISDFFMRQTLAGAALPQAGQVGGQERCGRVRRLLRNLARAAGLFSSRSAAIHARIYLCYVVGYLIGFCRWNVGTARPENGCPVDGG